MVQTCREKKFTLTLIEQLKFCVQIAAGMAYLASNRFIHMDLAARNCLVRANNIVKIADFGLVCQLICSRTHLILLLQTRRIPEGLDHFKLDKTLKLPIKWMAIEAMDERKFSEKSDVWSFGITCWEVFSYGLSPYNQIKNLDVQAQVRSGMRLDRPATCPEPFYALLHRCWLTKAAARPSFHDLRTEIVKIAQPIKQEGPMRDVGASLAKAGKETVYVGHYAPLDSHAHADACYR